MVVQHLTSGPLIFGAITGDRNTLAMHDTIRPIPLVRFAAEHGGDAIGIISSRGDGVGGVIRRRIASRGDHSVRWIVGGTETNYQRSFRQIAFAPGGHDVHAIST